MQSISVTSTVRRRHVVYVEGYDPRGPQGYFDIFRHTCARFERLWPFSTTLEALKFETEDFAQWTLQLNGPDWRVTTCYDFLRLERFIKSDMGSPILRQVGHALAWFFGDLFSGTHFRVLRASWRFGLHILCLQLLLIIWLIAAALIALVVGRLAFAYLHSMPMVLIAAPCTGFATLVASWPIVRRSYALQLCACWTVLRNFSRGRPTWYDEAIDVGARRVLAIAKTIKTDELVVVGHSNGCVIAMGIMARVMDLDPTLGRDGPRLVLLNLGSVMPGAALHPAARRMRTIVARLAITPALAWIECVSGFDIMCFFGFDPVKGLGLHVGDKRCNPAIWDLNFKDMIATEEYARFRRNFFRTHFQYIMAGDRAAPYDYILLIGGPFPITECPRLAAKLLQDAAVSRD